MEILLISKVQQELLSNSKAEQVLHLRSLQLQSSLLNLDGYKVLNCRGASRSWYAMPKECSGGDS